MKFPPAPPRPSRADRTRLPAALAALLLGLAVAQLALPSAVELPEPGPGRPLRLRPVVLPAVVADPAIAARPLFAPTRRPAAAGEGPSDAAEPMGGARAVGAVSVRGVARLFVRTADGKLRSVGIGGRVDDWRLDAVTGDAALFSRGGERVSLAISSSPPPRAAPGEASDDETAEEASQ